MKPIALALVALLVPAAAQAHGPVRMFMPSAYAPSVTPQHDRFDLPERMLSMIASFYGHGERLNRYTSTGEVFNPNALTAAHRSLPFGTRLRVSYRGRSVVVRVNDRGPAAWTGRSLDLSYGAARAIGLVAHGAGAVEVAILN